MIFKKKKFDRITAFLITVVMIFGILISRLAYVQLINGDYYQELADAMGEKPKTDIAPRGEILDRNGKKLATNTLAYSITYTFSGNSKDTSAMNNSLINVLDIIYKNGDQENIVANSFPINYDASKNQFSYTFSTDHKYTLVKQAESFKQKNKIQTSFDKNFDPNTITEFENSLKDNDNSEAHDNAVKDFEGKYLGGFNPNDDAKEALYLLAEKYGLVSRDSSGNIAYGYKTLAGNMDELVKAVAVRYSLKNGEYKQYQDIEIAKNVKKETAWEIQVDEDKLTGITTQVVPERAYPYGEVGSAFLGFMGKISNAEKYSKLGYDVSKELIGVNGLEYALENSENNDYNIQLRGEPGVDYVKVDKFGKVIEQTASIEPVPGDTVETSINIDMQAAAEKALDDTLTKLRSGGFGQKFRAARGATVVMDIHTGEILALASRPGFNPNDFAETGVPQDPALIKKYQLDNPPELYNDKYDTIPRPMFNYATQGAVMPGSTFKPFTAIAGLQEGVINKSSTVFDDGRYEYGPNQGIKCWKPGGHGTVSIVTALKVSCNFFFNTVGGRLGIDRFSEWAKKFGLTTDDNGKRPSTGIEISESPGNVGRPEDSIRIAVSGAMKKIVDTLKGQKYGEYTVDYGSIYYDDIYNMLLNGSYDEKKLDELGVTNVYAKNYIKSQVNIIQKTAVNKTDVLFMAMGQGNVALTPVQMVQYISTILNGGTRYKAHLVKSVLNPDGTVAREIQPEVLNKIDLNPDNVATVMEGMGKVTEELGGTAASTFAKYPIKTGGKTGTAEPGKQALAYRDNYSWFLGFAPLDKPEIAIATVIYDGGHGGFSAPVARAVYDVYFKDRPEMKDYLAKNAKH